LSKVLAESSWWVIRLQVALLYLNAAVAKSGVGDWANGTAAYYWFMHPTYGMPSWIAPALRPILTSPWGVIALTWGAMALEFSLFAGLLARQRLWPLLFWAGIGFHLTIWVVQGLASFFFSMAGALVLYLWHPERPMPLLEALQLRHRRRSGIAAKVADLGGIAGEEATQPIAAA
jgi:antimicrobial peptide system SdpB family protein